jgi:thioredoxin
MFPKIFGLFTASFLLSISLNSCSDSSNADTGESEAFTPEQFQDLITKNETVVVDFKADWCGPCKILGPTLEKVAESYEGKIKLQKIDVDQSPELAASMGIQGIPYVVKYVNGQKVNQLVGVVPEETVRKFFAE